MKLLSLRQVQSQIIGKMEPVLNVVLQDENGVDSVIAISESHRKWGLIQDAIKSYQNGDMTADDLGDLISKEMDITRQVKNKLIRVHDVLDGRMAISGNRITIDHEPIDMVLEAHIFRLLKEDGTPKDATNWRAFAKFIENMYANASEYVREQLFGWFSYQNLHSTGFTITSDGCFIGYKGCEGNTENPQSIMTGYAIVNGEEFNGHIPNKVGSLIEMPRKQVMDDPAVGCAPGLHIGTYNYAKNWSQGVLLDVKVNPRDVVSVPTHCESQKIRACRYTVLKITEVENQSATYDYDESAWDEDDAYCGECDEYGHYDGECDDDYDDSSEYESDEDDLDDDLEDEDDVSSPQSSSSFSEGDTIVFDYETESKGLNSYEVKITKIINGMVHGELTNGNGYRSFGYHKLQNVRNLDSGFTSDPIAPKARKLNSGDDAPTVGDKITISYTKLNGETKWYPNIVVQSVDVDYFRADTDHGLRTFTFDGVNSLQSLGNVRPSLRSDISDSSSLSDEDEAEIKKYGYGSDPWA